jgi:LacI family transcriptional regulator
MKDEGVVVTSQSTPASAADGPEREEAPGSGSQGQDQGPASDANVTIYDVAREVGCAPSTVSRAFSRPGRVSAATHARVMEAAKRLGYRTQQAPTQERATEQRRIGIGVPDLTNPYFAELVSGMQEAAHVADYLPILLDSTEDEERERVALERSLDVVDGIVLGGSRQSDSALLQVAKQIPLVVLNRRVAGLDSITPDYEAGIGQALAHLREDGARTMLYVAGPPNSWSDGERWRAIRAQSSPHELRVHRVGPFAPTARGGEEAYQYVLENLADRSAATRPARLADVLPDAVICYNDLQAVGLLMSALRDGVRVPAELSVIGHDDIPLARLMGGGLSTVATPKREQGRIAVERLIRRIQNPSSLRAPAEGVVPVKLVIRGSSGVREARKDGRR